jgi:protein-tyrosine-phosphatase
MTGGNILFLCTGNSARSILAEALLNRLGEGRWRAFSAGSFPRGEVHPMALRLLGERGFPTSDLRSKSWDEFAAPDGPRIDLVVTVCDNAAGETCPIWPGHPARAHWGLADPAAVDGAGQRAAFEEAYRLLGARIVGFLASRTNG